MTIVDTPAAQAHAQGSAPGHVTSVLRTGSSGATVTIVTLPDGTRRAVKTSRWSRVSAPDQAAARDRIAPHFPGRLPEVLHASRRRGRDVLVTECPSPFTLADLVAAHPARAEGVWADVVENLHRVWRHTARPGFDASRATRSHQMRWQRARSGLVWALSVLDLPTVPGVRLIVNGRDYGEFAAILQRLAAVPPPVEHVTCQGDPQPRNVLVDHDDRWHLVDWEWAGPHHDWRMLTSHLIGWWHIESLLSFARGYIATTSRGHIELTHDTPGEPCAGYLAPGRTAFAAMSSPSNRDADTTALAHHLAMLHLREIPNVAIDQPWLVAPLLGEAVRLATAPAPDLVGHLLTAPMNTDRRSR